MKTKAEVLAVETPAATLLGRDIVTVNTEEGGAVVRYTARAEFLNRHGTVHGGFLAAMLDSATALALYAVLPPELTAVTVKLDVAFLRPARAGMLTAHSRVLSRDRRHAEIAGELLDAESVTVATATAKFRIVDRKG
jgi:uncharacterized protein (TIGR00369 family)